MNDTIPENANKGLKRHNLNQTVLDQLLKWLERQTHVQAVQTNLTVNQVRQQMQFLMTHVKTK